MTQTEYENKRRECWEEFRTRVVCGTDNPKDWFERAFDRAYALGKQAAELSSNSEQLNAEGEDEMLWVSRKEIQQLVAANDVVILEAAGIDNIETIQAKTVNTILNRLFGSKCLPDRKEDKEPKNNADNEVIFIKHPSWQDEDDPDIAQHLAFLNSLSNEHSESQPAEPKFKLGDRVKDISSPHDDGVYKVDDIKKSSDGFIYHIQGLIGISNAKESDLEPYTEPKEDHIGEDHEMVKDFDTSSKTASQKERRLNIAVQVLCAIIPKYQDNGDGIGLSVLNEKDIIKCAFRIADTFLDQSHKTDK